MSKKKEILEKLNKKGLIKSETYYSQLEKLKQEGEIKDTKIEALYSNVDHNLISFA